MTLDQKGVGELIAIAIERGKAANPNLKIGICGEHAGDPASLKFFAGLRDRLRQLLALPGAGGPADAGAGGDCVESAARIRRSTRPD